MAAQGGAGYSLRGSSNLYAWVDSFLYLRQHHGQLLLSAEHRSASGAGPVTLELASVESEPYLRLAPQASELATHDQNARPDPLAEAAAGIIEHMKTDHKEALILLGRRFLRLQAQMKPEPHLQLCTQAADEPRAQGRHEAPQGS